jgi:hypothetical protein
MRLRRIGAISGLPSDPVVGLTLDGNSLGAGTPVRTQGGKGRGPDEMS